MAKSKTYSPQYNDLQVYNRLGRGDSGGWGYNVDSMQATYVGGGSMFPGMSNDYGRQKWGVSQSHRGEEGDKFVQRHVFNDGYMSGRRREGAGLQEPGHYNTGWGRGYQGEGSWCGHDGSFTFGKERRR